MLGSGLTAPSTHRSSLRTRPGPLPGSPRRTYASPGMPRGGHWNSSHPGSPLPPCCVGRARLSSTRRRGPRQSISGFIAYALCVADETLTDANWLASENEKKERMNILTCPKCYVWEIEHGLRMPLPQISAMYGANDLPGTMLSDHIEEQLFKQLREDRHEWAIHDGKSFDEGKAKKIVSAQSIWFDILKAQNCFCQNCQVSVTYIPLC
ncbi:hypothetical protein CFC21_005420 [Triticum aestivum]|uniref:Uncharacterized protein n=2 Tax=Triticum aestivum TaxID=4565 RepID=A0A9R1D9L1_WHEAT|nr:histone acetyltransferase HAC4-like [Triticum aestivum]KAF6987811.1 hypothetical protein CFC21_005420 [Triticum aestivum]